MLSPLLYIFLHKFLVELRAQRVIDEAFLLPCFVHTFSTILEHDIVIPPGNIITKLSVDDLLKVRRTVFFKYNMLCMNVCLCEIPSLHPECILTLGHLLLLLSRQIN